MIRSGGVVEAVLAVMVMVFAVVGTSVVLVEKIKRECAREEDRARMVSGENKTTPGCTLQITARPDLEMEAYCR